MGKIALLLAAALSVIATSAISDETFSAVVDHDARTDVPPAVWVVNQTTGAVRFCVVANNNTSVICSAWSEKYADMHGCHRVCSMTAELFLSYGLANAEK